MAEGTLGCCVLWKTHTQTNTKGSFSLVGSNDGEG